MNEIETNGRNRVMIRKSGYWCWINVRGWRKIYKKATKTNKGADAGFEMKQENQKKSGPIPANDNSEDPESAKPQT